MGLKKSVVTTLATEARPRFETLRTEVERIGDPALTEAYLAVHSTARKLIEAAADHFDCSADELRGGGGTPDPE